MAAMYYCGCAEGNRSWYCVGALRANEMSEWMKWEMLIK